MYQRSAFVFFVVMKHHCGPAHKCLFGAGLCDKQATVTSLSTSLHCKISTASLTVFFGFRFVFPLLATNNCDFSVP